MPAPSIKPNVGPYIPSFMSMYKQEITYAGMTRYRAVLSICVVQLGEGDGNELKMK